VNLKEFYVLIGSLSQPSGKELSDDKQCSENEIINHVKLFKWVGKNQQKQ